MREENEHPLRATATFQSRFDIEAESASGIRSIPATSFHMRFAGLEKRDYEKCSCAVTTSVLWL
jgi:hypothetical protein